MASSRTRPNMSLIAARLDVSVATVSNALAGKGRVSPDLAARIRAMANDLCYVPGMAGRALRTGRSYVLGLVLPDIANPLFPQIAQAIESSAAEAGYGVLIADSRNNVSTQTEVIGRLLERGVDGVVIVLRRGTRVADVGTPVAVIDSPSTPGNTVSADHWQGGQLVMDHLIGLGHRKILIIGNNPDSIVQNDRIGGMKSRLSNGAESEVIWVEKVEARHGPGCPLGLADYYRAGFTACSAVSDLTALRALTEILGAGISVPENMSVTGFDDLVWSPVVRPSLTTVRMDMATIARIAVEALTLAIERRAAGDDLPKGPVKAPPHHKESVPMSLVIRQSSARAMTTQRTNNGGYSK
ncbi:LacI family transcriptional regulator [Sinirhodobacter populi]|uniref:LacI family transcriptional regulator n=2 Tax=Paenirhodobacter populi TaxID=2306993 RepID=A0A443IYY8_9RHOB|nr:LacI family transcriptional regulator [Sinirhodobacter populi]